jgi:hypothetical protein
MFDKMRRDDRTVALFCDMHGHSRKKNIFVYGCLKKKNNPSRDLRPLQFPYILSNISNSFSFLDSRFKVQKSKYGTGRVVGWRGHEISLSFTMEASFCGPSIG